MKNVTKGLDDSLLEFDEEEMQKNYEAFYEDVFPEWEKFGKIVQFKCSNNLVSHLRGSLFIQYENIESAILAKIKMDERFYGGHPLRVRFSLIKDWKQAICAYNGPGMSSCPKFSECNFLHAYRNPRNEFPFERENTDRDRKGRFDGKKRSENERGNIIRPPNYDKINNARDSKDHRDHKDHKSKHRRHSRERDHKKESRRRSKSRSRSRSGSRSRSHHKKKSHKKKSHKRSESRSSERSRSRSKSSDGDKGKEDKRSRSKSNN